MPQSWLTLCQRPIILTPLGGGAPPVSRNRLIAALRFCWGIVQRVMNSMAPSPAVGTEMPVRVRRTQFPLAPVSRSQTNGQGPSGMIEFGSRLVKTPPPCAPALSSQDVIAISQACAGQLRHDESVGRSQQEAAAVHYSITWSARASSDGGIVRPRALAVFRLMIN